MSAGSAAQAGRRAAEARMTDTLVAYKRNGVTTDADGFEVPAYDSKGSTRGRIAGSSGRDTTARVALIGGVERPVVEGGLHIPVSAPVPDMGEYGFGWEYVVTAIGDFTDLALLGSRWLVVDSPAKSQATARRLDVVRLS